MADKPIKIAGTEAYASALSSALKRGQPVKSYVTRIEAVKAALRELKLVRVHAHFAGYLALIREANQYGRDSDLPGGIDAFFETFLRVEGGPRGRSSQKVKPYFRPFWGKNTSTWEQRCWFNENPAGSYAHKSLRDTLLKVVEVIDKAVDQDASYTLRPKHWTLARKHLVNDKRVPVFPLAVYLYRDFAITTSSVPTPATLVSIFREEFGYLTGDGAMAFGHLYQDDSGEEIAEQFYEEVPNVF